MRFTCSGVLFLFFLGVVVGRHFPYLFFGVSWFVGCVITEHMATPPKHHTSNHPTFKQQHPPTHLGVGALHALAHPHRRDEEVLVRLKHGREQGHFLRVGGRGRQGEVDPEGGGEDGGGRRGRGEGAV